MHTQPNLELDLEEGHNRSSFSEVHEIRGERVKFVFDEFWTSRQRQAKPIHEVSYRACFKPQLPEYFISRYSQENDVIYDPFAGRGTTAIQAALMGRRVIQNDVNPLSRILTEPRLLVPPIQSIDQRLKEIVFDSTLRAEIDLSMFFHDSTLTEILSYREYFSNRLETGKLDDIDKWIAMICTNRLTGHSTGFFSVYSFPPNIAVSPQSQVRINEKRRQVPPYRNTKDIILKKSRSLQANLSDHEKSSLNKAASTAIFFSRLASETEEIPDSSVQLTVTSPPFLDIVQYSDDNWMRCWFNKIDSKEVGKRITMSKTPLDWSLNMSKVIHELFRITKKGGFLAFEVGEIRNQKVKLEELVVPIGMNAGFVIENVLVNSQDFTKTSNLWGVSNNKKGTNTNRIVLMRKP